MGRAIHIVTPAAAMLTLDYQGSTIGELRNAVASLMHADIHALKLIHNGVALVDDQAPCRVEDGGRVLVVKVVRKPMVQGVGDDAADAGDDDVVIDRAQLRRKLCTYVVGAALWCGMMNLAQRFDLGPVAFLMTIILLIYINLGTRRPGEASAYSVFNNFVRLPGQLTAEVLDDQIRHGHM